MWQNPVCAVVAAGGDAAAVDHDRYQEEFDDFFFEIFEEFHKFGRIEEVQVCENLGDHMVGNVYVKFYDEEDAESALTKMNGRWYGGRILRGEYSPVTDFREARCRQYDESACGR
jgi:splicing factor U2AF subunit